MYKAISLIGIFTLLFSADVFSQGEEKRFHQLTINDGLSQSSVQAILQDSRGFMWFGTQDGLNRYDGYDFTVYKTIAGNPNSLSDNNINVLFEDSHQRLWIGTQSGGLVRYDRGKDNFIRYTSSNDESVQSLSSNTIWAITEDHEGLIWVGTTNGLNLFDPVSGRFRRILSDGSETSLSDNFIFALTVDDTGTLWVGTGDGLNRLNRETGEFKQYQTVTVQDESVSLGSIRSLYEDKRDHFWIGTEDKGLFLFDRENEQFTRFYHEPENPFSLSGDAIFAIQEDSFGNFWIGTGNDGLNILDRDNHRFYRYQQSNENQFSVNNNSITEIFESRDGIIWIGTFTGGINIFELQDRFFRHYINVPQSESSLSNNIVQSIDEDPNGVLWVGTDGGGLNLLDPVTDNITRIPSAENSLSNPSSNVILDIHRTEAGMWLATYGDGIDFYDFENGTFRNFRAEPGNPQSLSSMNVFTINESRDGNLWFSTNAGGLMEFDPAEETFRHFRIFQNSPDETLTLRNDDTRVAYEDSDGDVWIGTYGGYIHRYNRNEEQIRVYDINENSDYTASVVQVIHEDRYGTLWFGTRGSGLLQYDRGLDQLVPYATTDQNLPNNIVHSILEDQYGLLWLTTNNGISRFNPLTGEFSNLNVEHGLITREFNPRSGIIHSSGDIYFGSISGITRFHPDSIRIDETIHPVILTEFLLYNVPVTIGENSPIQEQISELDKISLPHNSSVITIGYTALNFSSIKGNQFAYRLLGFEETWNYVGTQRRATYTNLSPGEYEFQLMSANSFGVWNDEITTLVIHITPPFWRAGWFIGLLFFLISGVTLGTVRYRINSVRKEKIILEKTIRERTKELMRSNHTKDKLFSIIAHDLRNYAGSITGLASILNENIQNDNFEGIMEYTDMLEKTSYQFDDFLKNLLEWARYQTDKIKIEPKVFTLEKVINHVVEQSIPNANNKYIEIKTDIEEGVEGFADTNLFAIVIFNLINNAIKFSHPNSCIDIKATSTGSNRVKISVQDYGIGMTKDSVEKLLSDGGTFTKKGTAGERGTGLGFDLCKDFVDKNGGSIKIDSKPDVGTTVYFTLPKANTDHLTETAKFKSVNERYLSKEGEEVET